MKHLINLLLLGILVSFINFTVLAQQPTPVIFSPFSGNLKINEEKVMTVTLHADSKISAFDLLFKTSQSLVIRGLAKEPQVQTGFDPFNFKLVTKEQTSNTFHLAYALTGADSDLPSTITLYLLVKGDHAGNGKVEIDATSHLLDGNGTLMPVGTMSSSYTISDQPSSTAFLDTSTLPNSPYPASAAVVQLKLKLAGVDQTSHPSQLLATAVVVGRIGEGPYQTEPRQFPLTFNADQTFSGTVAFPDFKDGNKFSIMIKANNYLLRRICNPDASEKQLGQYQCLTPNLTIQKGETNSFDFSQVPLIPGDLGVSDGLINGYDLSVLRNNLNKKDATALKMADLNYDGLVDINDFQLLTTIAKTTNRQSDQ